MNEVVRGGPVISPDSDCNSNHHGSTSYLSTTSSQDIDFVQDNSDYQWFLDYGYRDTGIHHHTSILSLPEAYETADLNYYDVLSKNMDANLAEVDIESFKTEDIHALLTNLPPMCTDHLSQENNRQGESYASVSGSMMGKFDFDSSSSPQSEESANSIYKSELLFSPVKETPMPGANFSVDSLDCDMMLTCQANKDNYTIAFEGSIVYSETSEYQGNDNGGHWHKHNNKNVTDASMTQSDLGSFTTWSKLTKRNGDNHLRRHPSGNNNNSSGETSQLGLNENSSKSQSMPDLYKQKIKSLVINKNKNLNTNKRKPVKVFDIQHQSSSLSEMATSVDASTSDNTKQANFSLVKLFMKQKSMSTEGMSTTMDQLSSTEMDESRTSEKVYDQIAEETDEEMKSVSAENINRSIQTSQFSEMAGVKSTPLKKIKVVGPSFLNKLKQEGEQKPVYVFYPNYVLPNLDFLDKKYDLLLRPQEAPNVKTAVKKRPFSFNDIELLKKKGFNHIKDWESLNFLLPSEYKKILAEVPEVKKKHRRPYSCDYTSSSSSTGTQPSSGYRGSSSILNDSQNPLFVYRYDSVTSSEASTRAAGPPLPTRYVSLLQDHIPPRPPLPKGILRRDKRFSLYETSEEDLTDLKRYSETEDEGVDAGSTSSVDDHLETVRKLPKADFLLSNMGTEELVQLEEFLKLSGLSSDDDNEENLMQLRSHVGKFLSLKMNQDLGKKSVSFAEKIKYSGAPHNSPNVSAFVIPPIKEESESDSSPKHLTSEKRCLVKAVTDAVEQLINHFSSATNQAELNIIGDSGINPSCAKLALSNLCPALYAILSDGLKPNLETSFGAITNSVWQVVEASAQQGPLTKALNELVMRINGEDAISEGLVKFNAFVFGLLNVRSLDAFISYLRTRESILKKHYYKDSLLLLAHTGGPGVRSLLDGLIAALQPLALLPFQLDLLFEYRQLHLSFKRMDSYQHSPTHKSSPSHKLWSSHKSSDSEDISTITVIKHRDPELVDSSRLKERPRSCVEPSPKPQFKLGDVTTAAKKRWSGISINNKLHLVYDQITREEEEEYTDSLENESVVPPESLDSNLGDDKPIKGRRFKKLQQKWEMLSGREQNETPPSSPTSTGKSKIPRPVVSSPVKPSGIPVLVSPTGKGGKTPVKKGLPVKKPTGIRTSRVDMLENPVESPRHIPRPSSLPYKTPTTPNTKSTKPSPRRAASSSLSRRTNKKSVPKVVRTLSHRVPSESGHLSYNEGERLDVILEVDDKWLLCSRGHQKGLVPKSAVIDLHRF